MIIDNIPNITHDDMLKMKQLLKAIADSMRDPREVIERIKKRKRKTTVKRNMISRRSTINLRRPVTF